MADSKRVIDSIPAEVLDVIREELKAEAEATGTGAAGGVHPDIKKYIDAQKARADIETHQKKINDITKMIL